MCLDCCSRDVMTSFCCDLERKKDRHTCTRMRMLNGAHRSCQRTRGPLWLAGARASRRIFSFIRIFVHNSFAFLCRAALCSTRAWGWRWPRSFFSLCVPLVLASGVTSGGHIPGRGGRSVCFSLYSYIPLSNPGADSNEDVATGRPQVPHCDPRGLLDHQRPGDLRALLGKRWGRRIHP